MIKVCKLFQSLRFNFLLVEAGPIRSNRADGDERKSEDASAEKIVDFNHDGYIQVSSTTISINKNFSCVRWSLLKGVNPINKSIWVLGLSRLEVDKFLALSKP